MSSFAFINLEISQRTSIVMSISTLCSAAWPLGCLDNRTRNICVDTKFLRGRCKKTLLQGITVSFKNQSKDHHFHVNQHSLLNQLAPRVRCLDNRTRNICVETKIFREQGVLLQTTIVLGSRARVRAAFQPHVKQASLDTPKISLRLFLFFSPE